MTPSVPAPLLFHPLRSDEDAPHHALLHARSKTAFTWGLLQGRLAHLAPEPAQVFSCALVRLALNDALTQAGFAGAADWLPAWFSGLRPPLCATTHVAAPPAPLVDAVLAELTRARWEPLALAAQQIQGAARYDHGIDRLEDTARIAEIIAAAERLASLAHARVDADDDEDVWPLSALGHLHDLAAATLEFAPQTRERAMTVGPAGPVGFDLAAPPPPLWALDHWASGQTAPAAPGMTPLPLLGAVRAEALRPYLWPRERAILVAHGMAQAVSRLSGLLDMALAASSACDRHLHAARSTSRAPALYRILRGFGPLRPVQIASMLGVTKGGAREIVSALCEAGLAKVRTEAGRRVIEAVERPAVTAQNTTGSEHAAESSADEDSALAAFDAALADIDQLLERLNRSSVDK